MKKLLFIGHEFHKKTKSSDFMKELLAEKYDVESFYIDPYKISETDFNQITGKTFDLLILWQVMPSLKKLRKYIRFKQCAFFPMYDNTKTLNSPLWNEYKNCNIINFSKAFHKTCQDGGLSSYYIQYFPKPAEIIDKGDEKSIFFWQRSDKITTRTLEKVIDTKEIETVYLHKSIDPKNKFIPPSKNLERKVVYSSWFDTKEEMQKYIQKSALYFAPRRYEGIGMSFLEAMASGRCVIAPDYPTMNEYIKNGETGFLYNYKKPELLTILNVREIQKNTAEYIKQGYEKWEKEKYKIFDYIEAEPITNTELLNKHIYIRNESILLFGFLPARIKETHNEINYKIFNLFSIKKRK